MVNVLPIVTATTNAMTISRMRGAGYGGSRPKKPKKTKIKKPPVFLKEKFEEAWKIQEERLSKLETVFSKDESFCVKEGYASDIHRVYKYANGEKAKVQDKTTYDSSTYLYDELGNCILKNRCDKDNLETFSNRRVYYKGTKQKEFEWDSEGIRHFDKDGKEDTQLYMTKQKVAAKRIAHENQTGETLRKMSKVEKSVATALKDTKKMTFLERMLARKAKREK